MNAVRMSHWAGFGLVLLLAATLRFYQIGTESLWIDEARTWWFASTDWNRVFVEYPSLEVHPPLYFALTKLWIGVFGDSEGAMRALATGFSLAALLMVYLAARQAAGPNRPAPALAAATLFAVATQQIHYAQEVRFYAALAFAFSLVVYGAVWLLKRPYLVKQPIWRVVREDRGAAAAYVCLACGSALLMWFHTLGALYNIALALVLGVYWLTRLGRRPQALINLLIVAALALLIYSPNLANMWHWLTATNEGGYWLVKPDGEELLELFLFTYGFEQPYANKIDLALTGLVWLLSLGGAFLLAREGEGGIAAGLLVFSLLPFTLSTLITFAVQPTLLDRTLLPMFAPWSVLVGMALLARWPYRLEAAALGVVVAAYLVYAFDYYSDARKEPWRQTVAYIEANAEPGEPIFLINNIVQIAFDYYLRDSDHTLDIRPLPAPFPAPSEDYEYPIGGLSEPMLTNADARTAWDEAARDADRIWLVTRGSYRFEETLNYAEDWFAMHSDCTMTAFEGHLNMLIYRYDRPSTEPIHDTPSCGFDGDRYTVMAVSQAR